MLVIETVVAFIIGAIVTRIVWRTNSKKREGWNRIGHAVVHFLYVSTVAYVIILHALFIIEYLF